MKSSRYSIIIFAIFCFIFASCDKHLDYTQGKAVDLGLSVNWADRNIGASSEDNIGDFYMWGDTLGVNKIDKQSVFAYRETPPINISGTEMDAAKNRWGGLWRMPTEAEIDELINKCNIKWISDNGISGVIFKSKINGKQIFLPAAGSLANDKEPIGGLNFYGFYWTGTLKNNIESTLQEAYALHFFNVDGAKVVKDPFGICQFFSVRPVQSNATKNEKIISERGDTIIGHILYGMNKKQCIKAFKDLQKSLPSDYISHAMMIGDFSFYDILCEDIGEDTYYYDHWIRSEKGHGTYFFNNELFELELKGLNSDNNKNDIYKKINKYIAILKKKFGECTANKINEWYDDMPDVEGIDGTSDAEEIIATWESKHRKITVYFKVDAAYSKIYNNIAYNISTVFIDKDRKKKADIFMNAALNQEERINDKAIKNDSIRTMHAL